MPTPQETTLKARPYSGFYRTELHKPDETPNPNPDPSGNPDPTSDAGRVDLANLPPDERTFAKRYGDLRALRDKELKDYKQRLADLTNQIQDLSNTKKRDLPRTEAEIQGWLKEHPDLASMVIHLADSAAAERTKAVEQKLEQINARSQEIEAEKAYLELKKIHPDVDAIRASEGFHQWVEEQPQEIKDWFYENETDYIKAAKGIQLYKSETGITSSRRQPDPSLDNSRAVGQGGTTGNEPAVSDGKRRWTESEIGKLKPREFEKYEEDINLALQEGRVTFDLRDKQGTFRS